jgi:hypothetical protein
MISYAIPLVSPFTQLEVQVSQPLLPLVTVTYGTRGEAIQIAVLDFVWAPTSREPAAVRFASLLQEQVEKFGKFIVLINPTPSRQDMLVYFTQPQPRQHVVSLVETVASEFGFEVRVLEEKAVNDLMPGMTQNRDPDSN